MLLGKSTPLVQSSATTAVTSSTTFSTAPTSSTTQSPTSKTLLIVTSTVASIAGAAGLILAARGIYTLISRQSCTRVTPSGYSIYFLFYSTFLYSFSCFCHILAKARTTALYLNLQKYFRDIFTQLSQ